MAYVDKKGNRLRGILVLVTEDERKTVDRWAKDEGTDRVNMLREIFVQGMESHAAGRDIFEAED